jgi:hypothetical protein
MDFKLTDKENWREMKERLFDGPMDEGRKS